MHPYELASNNEGYGEVLETLASLRREFGGLSVTAFLGAFPPDVGQGAAAQAAEYMRQGDVLAGRLVAAVSNGDLAAYRTAPQVDVHVSGVVSHELFLTGSHVEPLYRIFVEHTNFLFGNNIWYYDRHVLIRHGLTRLRISTQQHVVRDALSGGIALDETKLSAAYESFLSLREHVTAADCRNDAERPTRPGSVDVTLGFFGQEQKWPHAAGSDQHAALAATFRTACRKLQEVSAALPALPI